MNAIKVVGKRKSPETPAECHTRSWKLEKEIDLINPYPRPRGFVFKARTWHDFEMWRNRQTNPRLW